MKAFVLRLPDDTFNRLRDIADERGQSMNAVLNIWVELQVAKHRKKRELERDEVAV